MLIELDSFGFVFETGFADVYITRPTLIAITVAVVALRVRKVLRDRANSKKLQTVSNPEEPSIFDWN